MNAETIETIVNEAMQSTKTTIAKAARGLADKIDAGELSDPGGAGALRALAKSLDTTPIPSSERASA